MEKRKDSMNLPTYMSGILFSKAHKLVRVQIYAVLEKHELNPIHWSILGATMQAPEGSRLSSVADLLGVKAPMVTTDAKKLIKQGLIRRIPHHSDARAKLLVITPEGKKLAKIIEDELSRKIAALLNGLTPEEVTIFQKVLQTIVDNSSKTA
jgi:DNA-binding MarR family transcriptional regulator